MRTQPKRALSIADWAFNPVRSCTLGHVRVRLTQGTQGTWHSNCPRVNTNWNKISVLSCCRSSLGITRGEDRMSDENTVRTSRGWQECSGWKLFLCKVRRMSYWGPFLSFQTSFISSRWSPSPSPVSVLTTWESLTLWKQLPVRCLDYVSIWQRRQ